MGMGSCTRVKRIIVLMKVLGNMGCTMVKYEYILSVAKCWLRLLSVDEHLW
mgnify:CR=1 FL=1